MPCSADVPAARTVPKEWRSRAGESLSYQTRPLCSLLEDFSIPCLIVERFCSIDESLSSNYDSLSFPSQLEGQ